MTLHCELCHSHVLRAYPAIHERHYYECAKCRLISLHPSERLSPGLERQRYELHTNDHQNSDYRHYLLGLMEELLRVQPPPAKGLDYGCGPTPALSMILTELGYTMDSYDPFFFPDTSTLEATYDFITSTEVLEHCFKPAQVLTLLNNCLVPNGHLLLATQLHDGEAHFKEWWYVRDPTHVSFFSKDTLKWIATEWRWELLCSDTKAHLLRKRTG